MVQSRIKTGESMASLESTGTLKSTAHIFRRLPRKQQEANKEANRRVGTRTGNKSKNFEYQKVYIDWGDEPKKNLQLRVCCSEPMMTGVYETPSKMKFGKVQEVDEILLPYTDEQKEVIENQPPKKEYDDHECGIDWNAWIHEIETKPRRYSTVDPTPEIHYPPRGADKIQEVYDPVAEKIKQKKEDERVKRAQQELEDKLNYIRNTVYQCATAAGRTEFKGLFDKIDADYSGTLDFYEFKTAVRKLFKLAEKRISDDDLHIMFDHLDFDSSGDIDVNELSDFMEASRLERAERPLPASAIKNYNFMPRVRRQILDAIKLKGASAIDLLTSFESQDSDGSLDFDELKYLLRTTLDINKQQITVMDLRLFWVLLDDDESGELSSEEFFEFLTNMSLSEAKAKAAKMEEMRGPAMQIDLSAIESRENVYRSFKTKKMSPCVKFCHKRRPVVDPPKLPKGPE